MGKAEYECIFEHISTESGLSHGSVSGMMKDHKGFMWFATWDGINRYDGTTFKTFKPGTSSLTGIASNRIEDMKEDSLGNIWVLTYDDKAFRFNKLTEQFDQIPNDFNEGVEIKEISVFQSGDVWLLTKNNGAYQVYTNPESNLFQVNHFHTNSKPAIKGNVVNFIAEDYDGGVWINSNKGIVSFQKNEKNELSVSSKFNPNFFENYNVSTLTETHSFIYFGTNKGVLLANDKTNKTYSKLKVETKSAITRMLASADGELFIGTSANGVFQYSEKEQKILKHYYHENIKKVLNLFLVSHKQLWIESALAGISKIDLETGNYKYFVQDLEVYSGIRSDAQCGFMEDEQQTLWLTLKGGGFGFYNHKSDKLEYFYNEPGNEYSKISNFLNCFYKDSSGVLWISTYFKGIEKVTFIQNKFRFTQPVPQVTPSIANEVRALLEDSQGYLWVANKKQEIYILDSTFNFIKKIDQLNGNSIGRVYAMLEDSKGRIYLGTKGNGLFRLTRSSYLKFEVEHFLHNEKDAYSLSNNNIYTLLEDSKNQIWVGTYGGGISILKDSKFLHAQNELVNFPLNKCKKVRHIIEDQSGNVWIGTTNGILFCETSSQSIEDFNFQHYNTDIGNIEGIRSNDVFWFLNDKQNNIWLASLGGGVAKLNNYPRAESSLVFSVFTQAEGLPSDVVFTIVSDLEGKLWMSTENGISCYDPKESVFQNFSQSDGIRNSGFSEAATTTRSDGSICFGGYNGIYSFNPSTFKTIQNEVALVFTSFQLSGKEFVPGPNSVLSKSISETPSIELTHLQNAFGITWAGLNYRMQDKMQFDYKLEAYEDHWNTSSTNTKANYTKVPPGQYIFKVKFSNPELLELNEPLELSIEILPPFWKTSWAYIIYLVLTIVSVEIARRIITSMIRLRNSVQIEKELSAIKLNFFTQISHELRTPLTLILGPSKAILNNEKLSERGKEYSLLIEQNAQRLLRMINQLLDFRKLQSKKLDLELCIGNIVSFTQSVCQNFEDLALEKKITFSLKSQLEFIPVLFDKEKMESVLFNLLSNAFKFTPELGKIEVQLQSDKSQKSVTISVADSGLGVLKEKESSLFTLFNSDNSGIKKQHSGTGIGLALSKELIELHKGKLSYKTSSGGGATFVIQLALQNATEESIQIESEFPTTNNETVLLHEVEEQTQTQTDIDFPRILIVEDHNELRRFLKLELQEQYHIEEASNGNEALGKVQHHQPDLILSDIMMPEMDGIQLLDKIKTNFDTSHIPVVLLTAKSSVESKIEGLKYGADAYLTKPFNGEQLKAQIENLLKQRELFSEKFTDSTNDFKNLAGISITLPDIQFLKQIREIIELNLSNTDFKTGDIYTSLGMGRSKFFDKLKGLTGLSPIDFIKDYRLGKAKKLLETGQYNVSEVSYLSGFTDASYFSKCFKEQFGVNPSKLNKV
ncbi:MAG: response regulator [Prolixibacteraceae bacterium]|nr:response regulator [Prolixibacteraceae bacterium]